MTKRGMFIVFEGVDGSGKTTQVARLADYIRKTNQEAIAVSNPGTISTGLAIRELLENKRININPFNAALLQIAAMNEVTEKCIRPALQKGIHVICDRFKQSTYVYQYLRGAISYDLIALLTERFHIAPDVTFIMDGCPDVFSRRREKRDNRRESSVEVESLAKIARDYTYLKGIKIDATKDENEVFQDVIRALRENSRAREFLFDGGEKLYNAL